MGFVADFEDHLISPEKWSECYDEMPEECKKVVDGPRDCVGIGISPELGWFTCFSGQGPCVSWSEKGGS